MKTLYDVLDVSPTAGAGAIEAAYQRLYAECGDGAANAAGATRLAALNQAYAVLGDPSRRRRYDRQLAARAGDPAAGGADARWLMFAGILALAVVGVTGIAWLVLDTHDQQAAVADLQATTRQQAATLAQQNLAQQQLQLENERLKAMVELTHREQDRRAKDSDQDAALAGQDQALRERGLNVTETDHALARTRAAESLRWQESDRRVRELENAARLQRETAAARLGVTDEQYQRLLEERGREATGLR